MKKKTKWIALALIVYRLCRQPLTGSLHRPDRLQQDHEAELKPRQRNVCAESRRRKPCAGMDHRIAFSRQEIARQQG